MVHLITYALHGVRLPDETRRIEDAIKVLGPCYAFGPGAWFVESELSNQEISQRLVSMFRRGDRFVATRIHRDWVSANLPQAETDWLSTRNFTSIHDDTGTVGRVPTVRNERTEPQRSRQPS